MNIKDRWCRLSFLQGHNLSVLSKRCLTSAKEDKVCPLSRTFYCPTEGWAWPVFRSSSHSCRLTFCSFVLLLLLLQVTPWSSVTVFSFFLSRSVSVSPTLLHIHIHLLLPLSPLLLRLLIQWSSKLPLAHRLVLHTYTLGGGRGSSLFLWLQLLLLTKRLEIKYSLIWKSSPNSKLAFLNASWDIAIGSSLQQLPQCIKCICQKRFL